MQGILARKNKIFLLLRQHCFYIRQLAGTQDSNKYFNWFYFAGLLVNDTQFISCKINVELVTRLMLHVHGRIYLRFPLRKIMFELALAYFIRMLSLISFP